MRTIRCAAIWFDDGVEHPNQPVSTGLVLCGWRHCNIFPQTGMLLGQRKAVGIKEVQGFLTSDGKFVDRRAAGLIALAAGQIKEPVDKLTSEDIY